MSREYRLRVEVTAREDSVDERAAIWDAAVAQFPDPPDEEERPEGDALILVFEGGHTLSGGTSPQDAHDHIRSQFDGRAVGTMWWYLERAPDNEFHDEAEAAG